MRGLAGLAAGCSLAVLAAAWGPALGQAGADSYFEFGTVVALGKHDVDVQTFDPQRQRLVQRSFGLGKTTQADAVHVGDAVEVIYTVGGSAGADRTLVRLIAIHGEVPKAGPAGGGLMVYNDARPATGSSAAATVPLQPAASVPALPSTGVASTRAASPPVESTRVAASPAAPAVVPARKPVTTGRAGRGSTPAAVRNPAVTTSPTTIAASKAATGAKPAAASQPVTLGGVTPKAVPGVVPIPLGVGSGAGPKAPGLRGITQEAPGQQCGREADWPGLPISMAVLDFRYPTEHEEANDVSKTGGGSGTAIADLVYNELAAEQPEFQMRRGDREKLFRMDFAGAARLGRQLGVDLVLLGTFAPVDVVSPDPAYPNPTQAYTLRAGVVETCTGQLLYKLTSITCAAAGAGTSRPSSPNSPPSPPPAKGSVAPSCPGSEIAVKDTINPLESAGAYRQPIEQLLGPLLHNTTPPGVIGSAGVVTAANGATVTIRVGPQGVRPGQQVSIHSFRLAKNPTTNTLERFMDTEIGRMTVGKVSGGSATGTYQGDVAPKVGDTAEVITE